MSVVAGCPFFFIEALHSITKVVLSWMAPPPSWIRTGFIGKWNTGQCDQMTVLDQSDQRISINVMTVVIIVFLLLSHMVGVVLDCVISWCLPSFLLLIVLHCLRRRDTKESTCLLRHITTEKSGLCQYAVCITQNATLKSNKHWMAINNPFMETSSNLWQLNNNNG